MLHSKLLWRVTGVILGILALVYGLQGGYVIFLIGVPVGVLCLFVAWQFPITAVVSLLLADVLPYMLTMIPGFKDDYGSISGGLYAVDVVLVSMLAAASAKLVIVRGLPRIPGRLRLFCTAFSACLLFAIVRNLQTYQISTVGEFRFRYLILALPLYLSLSFNTAAKRSQLFKILIISAVFLPLACIPVIGFLKGWTFGFESRFLPASTHLGMVYGLVALLLKRKSAAIRAKKALLAVVFLSSSFIILVDGHRSVWLAGLVMLVLFFWFEHEPVERRFKQVFVGALFAAAVLLLTTASGINVFHYVSERTGEIYDLSEKPEQTTVAWRLEQWELQFSYFLASPVFGEGFGRYWGTSGIKGDTGVAPHSLYVQTLIKLGILGLSLYLFIVIALLRQFTRWIRQNPNAPDAEMAIVCVAAIALVAAQVFYLGYSFEYYTWLFVGLGLAVVRYSSGVSRMEGEGHEPSVAVA